jgi:SAM-dependent methyltransferase
MFVPDPPAALGEMRRVLKTGGLLVFNVWDRIESNPTALANAETVEGLYPGDGQVRFRVPFEMHDVAFLRNLVRQARFRETRIDPKHVCIETTSARDVAIGQIRGSPRGLLLEKRGANLEEVIEKVAAALTRLGGAAPYRSEANAIVVEAVAA